MTGGHKAGLTPGVPLSVPDMGGPARSPLSEATREAARRLMAKYPQPRSALLPLLYLVQAEHGYVSREGTEEVAQMLDLTLAEVAAVSTFYTMFKREPTGRYLISVCTQPPCQLRGALEILRAVRSELGVEDGGTTADGSISVEEVECLCACDGAPVVGVNYENYEHMTVDKTLELVRAVTRGEAPPPPERGEVPKTAPEAHRELSGLHGLREEGKQVGRSGNGEVGR